MHIPVLEAKKSSAQLPIYSSNYKSKKRQGQNLKMDKHSLEASVVRNNEIPYLCVLFRAQPHSHKREKGKVW